MALKWAGQTGAPSSVCRPKNTLSHEHNTVRHFTLNQEWLHKGEVSTSVDISLTLKAVHAIVARSNLRQKSRNNDMIGRRFIAAILREYYGTYSGRRYAERRCR